MLLADDLIILGETSWNGTSMDNPPLPYLKNPITAADARPSLLPSPSPQGEGKLEPPLSTRERGGGEGQTPTGSKNDDLPGFPIGVCLRLMKFFAF